MNVLRVISHTYFQEKNLPSGMVTDVLHQVYLATSPLMSRGAQAVTGHCMFTDHTHTLYHSYLTAYVYVRMYTQEHANSADFS